MHLHLPAAVVLGTFANLCVSYAVTTTILMDPYQFASTEAVTNAASSLVVHIRLLPAKLCTSRLL